MPDEGVTPSERSWEMKLSRRDCHEVVEVHLDDHVFIL